jgi:hypothetical protein
MSLRTCLHKKTPSVYFPFHWLVVFNRLEKGFQSDGVPRKAGDEIRTRDSLLGKQVVAKTSPACSEAASQAH